MGKTLQTRLSIPQRISSVSYLQRKNNFLDAFAMGEERAITMLEDNKKLQNLIIKRVTQVPDDEIDNYREDDSIAVHMARDIQAMGRNLEGVVADFRSIESTDEEVQPELGRCIDACERIRRDFNCFARHQPHLGISDSVEGLRHTLNAFIGSCDAAIIYASAVYRLATGQQDPKPVTKLTPQDIEMLDRCRLSR